MKIKKGFIAAFCLLTIIPLFKKEELKEEDLLISPSLFPIVGLIEGTLCALFTYLISLFLPKDPSILFSMLLLVLINGGFHLDGLSDTFDGISIKPLPDKEIEREKRLSIMGKGVQGPSGSTAILFDLFFRFVLLREIWDSDHFFLVLSLLPVPSKFAIILSMFLGKPAKKEGIGALFIGKIKKVQLLFSFIFFLIPILFSFRSFENFTLFFLFFLLILLFSVFLLNRYFESKFGGLTGDMLGAINEIVEVIFLFWILSWSKNFGV